MTCRTKALAIVGILIAICSRTGSANAAPITIDFTSALYNGANGTGTFNTTDQGVSVALSSSGGLLSKTSDGLGVDGPTILDDPGEVGFLEVLTGGFAPPLTVYSFSVRQLFYDEFGGPEMGTYRINGGGPNTFTANVSNTGLLTVNLGSVANVTSLQFGVPGNKLFSDYSVASMSVEQPVPEPASMMLLGTGLAAAAARLRRRKA
jgi:hypothetical protein